MRERILKNWSLVRIFYLLIGGYVAISALMDKQWLLVLAGLWFTAMGVFGLGCASGNCSTKIDSHNKDQDKESLEVEYKEVK